MAVRTIPVRVNDAGRLPGREYHRQVQAAILQTQLHAGIVTVFIKHTTASVLIIEDEPGIRADTKALWERLIPVDPLGSTIRATRGKITAIAICAASSRGSR